MSQENQKKESPFLTPFLKNKKHHDQDDSEENSTQAAEESQSFPELSPSVILERSEVIRPEKNRPKSEQKSLSPITSDNIVKELKETLGETEEDVMDEVSRTTITTLDDIDDKNPFSTDEKGNDTTQMEEMQVLKQPHNPYPEGIQENTIQPRNILKNKPTQDYTPVKPVNQDRPVKPENSAKPNPPPQIKPQPGSKPSPQSISNGPANKELYLTTTHQPLGPDTKVIDLLSAEIMVPKDIVFRHPAPFGDLHRLKDGEDVIQKMKNLALQELKGKAKRVKADAVIGVSLHFVQIDIHSVLVSATGTAICRISKV